MSVLDVDDELARDFPFLLPFVKYTKFAVVLVFCLAILAGVYWFFTLVHEMWATKNSRLSGLAVDSCAEQDLKQIHQIATDVLADIPTYEETLALYRHNKKCIKLVVDMRKNKKLVGYLVLLPLTKAGAEKIERKTFSVLHDGLTIFGKRMPSKSDYYLGAAVAPEKLARAKSVQVIKEFCKQKRVTAVYARPMTEEGLQALKNNNFQPVHSEDLEEIGVFFFRRP